MKTRTILGSLIGVLLFGCGSFNRSEHYTFVNRDARESWARDFMGPPPPQRRVVQGRVTAPIEEEDDRAEASKPTPKPVAKPAVKPKPIPRRSVQTAQASTSDASNKPALCPLYTPPPLGKVPELPFDELEKVKGDPARIDALERQHIVDLRNYIQERQRVSQAAQAKYLEECQKIIQGHTASPK
ncbi:hypothetical protein D3C71_78130 [compost metagenome]